MKKPNAVVLFVLLLVGIPMGIYVENKRTTLSSEHLQTITNTLYAAASALSLPHITNAVALWKEDQGDKISRYTLAEPSALREWPMRYTANDMAPFLRALIDSAPYRRREKLVKNIRVRPSPQLSVDVTTEALLAQVWFGKGVVSLKPTLLALTYGGFRQSFSHELVHYYVQGDRGESILRGGTETDSTPKLIEGITEFLTLSAIEKLGWPYEKSQSYPNEVTAIGALVAFGAKGAVWRWYLSPSFKKGWDEANSDFGDALVSAGFSQKEAAHFLVEWENKADDEALYQMRKAKLLREMASMVEKSEQFEKTFNATLKAFQDFIAFERSLKTHSYDMALADGTLEEKLGDMAFEYAGREFGELGGYPPFLITTVIPKLRETASLRSTMRTPEEDIALRLETAAGERKGGERFAAMVTETNDILREKIKTLTDTSKSELDRTDEMQIEFDENEANIKSLSRINEPLLQRIAASPRLQKVVEDSDIPKRIKAQLLALP